MRMRLQRCIEVELDEGDAIVCRSGVADGLGMLIIVRSGENRFRYCNNTVLSEIVCASGLVLWY